MSNEEKTLRDIFEYIGVGHQYSEYAALHTYLKQYAKDSIPLATEVDVKTASIEFRPDRKNIDEIVAKNVDVHLEYMDDSDIWMSISDGKDEYHIHIQTKKAHIKTWAEIC